MIEPHFATLGITRLADITGLDRIGLPVFTAHRPNSRSLAVTQGKGATSDAARASAVMEALEQHYAESPNIPLRYAAAHELERTGTLIDLDCLPRIEGSELSLDRRALWSEGRDLATGAALFVPYELIHMDYTLPLPPGLGCFLLSSTGLASGNTLDEALVHALSEAIERDAVALWHRQPARHSACRVNPTSVDDRVCLDILELFEAAGVAVAIWDITSDVGVAAFFSTIIDREAADWRGLYAASGSGCHPGRGIALARALTEAAQSRLTLIAGARDDRSRLDYRSQLDFGSADRLRAEITGGVVGRRFSDVPDHSADELDVMLAWLLQRLRHAGLGAPVMVDLSKPGIPVVVVRVLVPALEGPIDAPGHAPGARALACAGDGAAA